MTLPSSMLSPPVAHHERSLRFGHTGGEASPA